MSVISLRMPEDVIEELKEIAPALGFSGYQPLIRAYIGQGLRKDQARLENSQVQILTESLRKHGIADQVISAAIAETLQPPGKRRLGALETEGFALSKKFFEPVPE